MSNVKNVGIFLVYRAPEMLDFFSLILRTFQRREQWCKPKLVLIISSKVRWLWSVSNYCLREYILTPTLMLFHSFSIQNTFFTFLFLTFLKLKDMVWTNHFTSEVIFHSKSRIVIDLIRPHSEYSDDRNEWVWPMCQCLYLWRL